MKSNSTTTFERNPLAKSITLETLALGGVLASQLLFSAGVSAAPAGEVIVGGTGSVSRSDLTTKINQSSKHLAINWDTFNVGKNEKVQFIQPSSSSIVLNRILDQNPSMIHGSIDANGNVLLVNPRGIMFTESATVNVGGLVASGLDVSISDFMNGDILLKGVEGEGGAVINSGVINASSAALVGKSAANTSSAMISADVVSLSAGDEALLTFDTDGLMGVKVTKEVLENDLGLDSAVVNQGSIDGKKVLLEAAVSKDLFSSAVNNEGVITAKGIDVSGGTIRLFGDGGQVANSGSLNASGESGGTIKLEGNKVVNSGELVADGTNGTGGAVKVLGDEVEVGEGSLISARGTQAGGEILIGGDYLGKNENVRNATTTTVAENTVIDASGIDEGDGGKVIVWANEDTYFYGYIDASSGLLGGDGGFVETSGKKTLTVDGTVVAKSHAHGKAGMWLLDPSDFTIGTTNGTNQISASDLGNVLTDGTSVIITARYHQQPSGTNVDLSGSAYASVQDAADETNGASGSIVVDSLINFDKGGNNNATLILDAEKNITLNAGVKATGNNDSINLELKAGKDITINSAIETAGGYVNFTAGENIAVNNNIATNGGLISFKTDADFDAGALGFGDGGDSYTSDGVGSINIASGSDISTSGGNVEIDTMALTNEGTISNGSGNMSIAVGRDGQDSNNTLGNLSSGNAIVVNARGGENDNDQFVFSSGNTFTLTGANALTTNGITNEINISGADTVDAGSNGQIVGRDDVAETFSVGASANAVDVAGITFNDIANVDGGSSSDPAINDVVESTTPRAWELTGNDNELIAVSITFSNVEVAQHEGTVSGSSTVTGSGNADTFEIEGVNTITANGVLISSIDTVDGGNNSGGNDVLTSSSAEAWQLSTDADVQVVHFGINFSGLEEANAATGSSVLGTSGDDIFVASGEAGKVSQKGLTYSNITLVDAGTGIDTLTASDGHTWTLTGVDNQLSEDGITYSNMEVADANNATVQGADGVAETFTIGAASNTVEAGGFTFTSVLNVDGGSGAGDVVESTATRSWELTGNNQELIAASINFSDVEVAQHEGTVSGSSTVTGSG
ncbi:filamentous hemagglutinin N-terminal domain-containing protein, partial [Aestuariicella sp. G3-2]|uniref:two-partner secretion domain-containing protein n=1 Tax=Pseudomaricurvus albidus TaxID=2842452 RepID=UPI001C0B4A85|nr:filamentous hemagglutinin N-terminal domain-containing protein [Aestuariicella albida]